MVYTLKRNQANTIAFVMIDASGVEVAGLGTSFNVVLGIGTAALAAGAGTKREVGSGWYHYTLTPAECATIGTGQVVITAAGCVQQNIPVVIESAAAGVVPFVYTLTSTAGGAPIAGAQVVITTDAAGAAQVFAGVTDAAGQISAMLAPGTYYLWRHAAGFTFSNPDTEVVA